MNVFKFPERDASNRSKKRIVNKYSVPVDIDCSGFGLIEVMIAVSILSVIGLMTASVLQANLLSQNAVGKDYAMMNMTEEIRSTLSDTSACLNSFGGMNPQGSGVTVSQIKDSSGNPVFQVGTNYENNKIKLTNISLSNYDVINGTPVANNVSTLTITYQKVGDSYGSGSLSQQIYMETLLNASNQITGCISLAKMEDGIWSIVPGTKWNIEYTGGSVGINKQPQVALDVNGPIRPGSASVAVGGSCPSEGAFAYDKTAHSPVFCSQKGKWTTMGGGDLMPTETVSSGNNCGPSGSTVTSAKPHYLCTIGYVGIWDAGHLYSFNISINKNANGTWTANDHSSRCTNLTMTCYDPQ